MFKSLVLFLVFISQSFAAVDFTAIGTQYTDQHMGDLKTPGAVVAIVEKGQVVYHKTYGKRDLKNDLNVERETLFRIGSLTKTFTATAIVLLREKGLLKLDDAAELYVKELEQLRYPYANSPKVTIRHLMTHTSGLIRHPMPADQSIEGLIDALLNPEDGSAFISSAWYPGYRYQYSNVGISLLGEIIARLEIISLRF